MAQDQRPGVAVRYRKTLSHDSVRAMNSRRQFIIALAGAGIAGPVVFWRSRTTDTSPVDVEQFPIRKSDSEWRAVLTPDQYKILRGHGPSGRSRAPSTMKSIPGRFSARVVVNRCFRRGRSSRAGPDGPASGSRSTRPSGRASIAAFCWCGPKCTAHGAVVTSATCSRTGPGLRGFATASTGSR